MRLIGLPLGGKWVSLITRCMPLYSHSVLFVVQRPAFLRSILPICMGAWGEGAGRSCIFWLCAPALVPSPPPFYPPPPAAYFTAAVFHVTLWSLIHLSSGPLAPPDQTRRLPRPSWPITKSTWTSRPSARSRTFLSLTTAPCWWPILAGASRRSSVVRVPARAARSLTVERCWFCVLVVAGELFAFVTAS